MPGERGPVRTMVVRCADWPVLATGRSPGEPVAVVHANRVVACSPRARAEGVQVGHRRREAQGRCPGLDVLERDESLEARAFEGVVRAVETFTPRLELTRPGACIFPTRGPSRYFGGDHALAALVHEAVEAVLVERGWSGAGRVGVADGPFAAQIAARTAPAAQGTAVVPAEGSPAFLAPLPIASLHEADRRDITELIDVWYRLGLTTLADLAALPARDVMARFGLPGSLAHRLAAGLDNRPPDARDPPPDLEVATEVDPPADRVDRIAFIAKALADDLFAQLEERGLSCTRIVIAAETEHGETIERAWRHEGTLTAGAVTDRVRWQLEGWLHASAQVRPSSGVCFLRLLPDEVIPAHGRQLGFWGGETDADIRAARALARVQGLLGPDAVRVPEWRGRRAPGEQLVLVPVAAVDLTATRPATRSEWVTPPWPGQIPAPAPAVIPPEPPLAHVADAEGAPVTVNGRAIGSGAPAAVAIGDGPWIEVEAWAGPWPADERWWDPRAHRRRARYQVILADGTAHLLTLEAGQWSVEATYD
jgi:protein ImuB